MSHWKVLVTTVRFNNDLIFGGTICGGTFTPTPVNEALSNMVCAW